MKITFNNLLNKVHLWLGLTSGLLVFIIAITGCIYAFQEEIQNSTQPYRFVDSENKNFLPPSVIKEIANKHVPGKHIHAVMYKDRSHAAQAIYFSLEDNYYYTIYLNPYTGKVLYIRNMYSGFFYWILEGHFYLWLPHEFGQPIVASTTLVFTVLLFSGLYLWWKRKGTTEQKFKIKWDARWRRKNYDLHNVFGFYITSVAFIFAITGLVWGFEWFTKSYYKLASGGKDFVPFYEPLSDTLNVNHSKIETIDLVWYKMLKEYPKADAIEVHIPETKTSSIGANANPDASTYWKADYRYFDQYTLKELSVKHLYNRFNNSTASEKLMKMNYDIHTGAVVGLTGKVLAFFASLIIASLPITGFLIWWGRKKKEKKVNVINVMSAVTT